MNGGINELRCALPITMSREPRKSALKVVPHCGPGTLWYRAHMGIVRSGHTPSSVQIHKCTNGSVRFIFSGVPCVRRRCKQLIRVLSSAFIRGVALSKLF